MSEVSARRFPVRSQSIYWHRYIFPLLLKTHSGDDHKATAMTIKTFASTTMEMQLNYQPQHFTTQRIKLNNITVRSEFFTL